MILKINKYSNNIIKFILTYLIILLLVHISMYSKDINLAYTFIKNDIVFINKCDKQSWCTLKDKSGYIQRFNFVKVDNLFYKALYTNYKYKKISNLKNKKKLLRYMNDIISFANKNERYNFEFGFIKVLRIEEFNKKIKIKKLVKIDKKINLNKKILTFNDILKQWYQIDEDLKKLRNQQKILKATINHKKLGYLPDIEFEYNLNHLKKDMEKNNIAYDEYKNSFSINTQVNLYDFGLRNTLINTYKKDIEIKNLEICEQKIHISINLLDIYIGIYKQRKTLKILYKLLYLYEKKHTMKARLLKQGLIASINTLYEQDEILNLKNKITFENTKLQDNVNKLYYKTQILLLDDIYLEEIKIKEKLYINGFSNHNIRTIISKKQIQKIHNEIKFYKKSNMPKIKIYYNNTFYNEYNDKIHTSFDYRQRDYSIGFRISWNFSTYFKNNFEKIKKQLEIKNHIISYNKYKKDFQINIKNKYIQIQAFNVFSKHQLELLNNAKLAIKINERLYEQGFEYKYKILESNIKLLNIDYLLESKKIENDKNKKYLSLLLEKENLCIHL